ncbi:MAG TPA: hypothetical protein VJ440_01150 [Candidatus Brocadiaceae bacterium]|nr:hypothetical protein [Candidatus Brocadiaceae bacterium]
MLSPKGHPSRLGLKHTTHGSWGLPNVFEFLMVIAHLVILQGEKAMCLRDNIDEERKQKGLSPINDHQTILVGSNPLPCYVAVIVLRPKKVTFVCSKATMVFAEKLKIVLNKEGIECSIPDGIDDTCSAAEISDAINKIEDVSGAGLHYAGGKKTMSVHAHRAWISKSKDITQASYIDAQKVALLFDNTGIEIPLKKKPCVSFDTLVDLHGITSATEGKKGYKISPAISELAMKMGELVKEMGIDKFRNVWPPFIPFIRCDSSYNPIDQENKERIGTENIRKDDVKKAGLKRDVSLNYSMAGFHNIKLFFDQHYYRSESSEPYTFSQFAGDFLGYPEKPLSETPGGDKLEKAFKWIDGEWLEEYTFKMLQNIEKSVGLHDVIYDINMKKKSKNKDTGKEIATCFQGDVACMRGHTVFFFSCTTSPVMGEQKLKLFEAQVRAQQLGGDHARYALVCLSNSGEVAALKNEVKESWDAPDYAEVFGWDAVMGNFAEALTKWINNI